MAEIWKECRVSFWIVGTATIAQLSTRYVWPIQVELAMIPHRSWGSAIHLALEHQSRSRIRVGHLLRY